MTYYRNKNSASTYNFELNQADPSKNQLQYYIKPTNRTIDTVDEATLIVKGLTTPKV